MLRSVREIISDLTKYDPTKSETSERLSHDCYAILVGYITDDATLKELLSMVQAEESQHKGYAVPDSIPVMESECATHLIEYVKIKYSINDLNKERSRHFVYEDHFNSSLLNFMQSEASYEKLKRICRKYEAGTNANPDTIIEEHESRSMKTCAYFKNKGLSEDEARAAAFAIAFYTGSRSEAVSRGASLVARRANGIGLEQKTESEMREASIILYYLVKGLSYVPYYWGCVTRACELNGDELAMYEPGSLITWLQFSSSKKGKRVAGGGFAQRNTQFKIFSLTGRPIQQFSNFEDEDEVLFLPHSTFFVLRHLVTHPGPLHTIYMRQVELGLSKWSILWVDDKIFDENWENKGHMEDACSRAMNINVHFVPKPCTNDALSFLRSPFGERLKNKDNFRIVTDMNRENETPIHDAGARLIKAVRNLGFENKCLVFTSDRERGENILRKELTDDERRNTLVTVIIEELHRFINFD